MTLEAKLAEPIDEWMAFLDPSQSKVVRRSFNGPCRIRGSAGTGKTVVGLHRAAYLARSVPGRVLVTTYISTLHGVLRSQLQRLAPEAVHRVDFRGVHEFAREVLKRNGVRNRTDDSRASAAFSRVWARCGPGLLGPQERDYRYWKEEIDYVIKGRGLTSLDQYRESGRTGRRRRLTPEQRSAVWTLYEHYQRELQRENIWDFADLILHAGALLEANPMRDYSAVVIDEAQDLTCAMVRMLHRLVGDAPDGLTLIGDGQQTIYPGGFTLAEAGISLAGRGVVLSTNFRNTVEIVEFARRLVEGDTFTDIEGTSAAADAYSIARHGPSPRVSTPSGSARRDVALVEYVRGVLGLPDVCGGDVGVLARYNSEVERALKALATAGIPAMRLADYTGECTDRVKVGTIKRAKGLEFKQVVVMAVPRRTLAGSRGGSAERSDKQVLEARELYVAMTRARDGLCVVVDG